jgi:hypothetical protein
LDDLGSLGGRLTRSAHIGRQDDLTHEDRGGDVVESFTDVLTDADPWRGATGTESLGLAQFDDFALSGKKGGVATSAMRFPWLGGARGGWFFGWDGSGWFFGWSVVVRRGFEEGRSFESFGSAAEGHGDKFMDVGLLTFDGDSERPDAIQEFLALRSELLDLPGQDLHLFREGEMLKLKRTLHTRLDARTTGKVPDSMQESRAFLESLPRPGVGVIDATEDHGELGGGDGQSWGVGGGKEEGAFLQTVVVEGKAVAHPGEDLESVASPVAEDEEVTGGGITSEERSDDAREAIDSFATILGLNGEIDGTGHAERDHAESPRAWMSRARWWGSAERGTRKRSPEGSVISMVGSGMTRMGMRVCE